MFTFKEKIILTVLLCSLFILVVMYISTSSHDTWEKERSECEKEGGVFTHNDPRVPTPNTMCTTNHE